MCEFNGDISFPFLKNFWFCFFLLKFYFVLYFTFLVTKTKIWNRKAVFQADSPIKGSRDLAW